MNCEASGDGITFNDAISLPTSSGCDLGIIGYANTEEFLRYDFNENGSFKNFYFFGCTLSCDEFIEELKRIANHRKMKERGLKRLEGRHTLPLNFLKDERIIFDYDMRKISVQLDWPDGYHDMLYSIDEFSDYLKELIIGDINRKVKDEV